MATVTKGRTFVSGETVTPAKLNELVDNATVTNIQTADIADGQVTSAKIADGTIVNADISASAAIAYSKLNLANSIVAGDITASAVTPAKLSQPYTLATAQASTSGTSIDFTGIPSWVRRITVMFEGVSTNGSDNILVQTGSGSFDTSGYIGAASYLGSSTLSTVNSTAGYLIQNGSAANTISGSLRITLLQSNSWVANGVFGFSNTSAVCLTAGARGTSSALDRIRITTTGGTNTFDAGTINIAYEG